MYLFKETFKICNIGGTGSETTDSNLGCVILLLEGHYPAEFSFDQSRSSVLLETSMQVFWGRLELNSA